MGKWALFHKKNVTPEELMALHFKKNLFKHLTTIKPEGRVIENHPADILYQASSTLGKLSRIFEQFDFPVPDYTHISKQVRKIGLSQYAQSLLENILPTMIDESGTKLNKEVIQAINEAGLHFKPPVENLYDVYCNNFFEEEIAQQFAQAIIIGFAQHILDAETAKSRSKMEEKVATLREQLKDVDEVLAQSLSHDKKQQLEQLRNTYQAQIKEATNEHTERLNRFHETFNTPMEVMAKRITTKGLTATIDIESLAEAKEFMNAFDSLVQYADEHGVLIPGLDKAQHELKNAREILNDQEDSFAFLNEVAKVAKIKQGLLEASDKIIDAMDAELDIHIPSPKEQSIWQKFLNLFFTTKEVAHYNKQQHLLEKIQTAYKQQAEGISFIKIEVNEQGTQIENWNPKLRDKILKELNQTGEEYEIDEKGVITRRITEADVEAATRKAGLMEQLGAYEPSDLFPQKTVEPPKLPVKGEACPLRSGAGDTADLIERLKTMSADANSHFQFKIIESEGPEQGKSLGMR